MKLLLLILILFVLVIFILRWLGKELMINKMILSSQDIKYSIKRGVYIQSYTPTFINENDEKYIGIESCWIEHSYKNQVGYIFNRIKRLNTFNLILKLEESKTSKTKPYKITSSEYNLGKNILHSPENNNIVGHLSNFKSKLTVQIQFEKSSNIKSIEVELNKK